MNIIKLCYDSTNYYLVQYSDGFIMVDTGWAGTFKELKYLLKKMDVNINDIKYILNTHYHPDHCGLVENIKEYGAKHIIHEIQVPFIAKAKEYFKSDHGFKEINLENSIVLNLESSKEFFIKLGINGELIVSNSHSEDSICFAINNECIFTGDLKFGENFKEPINIFNKIKELNIKIILPGHGKEIRWVKS